MPLNLSYPDKTPMLLRPGCPAKHKHLHLPFPHIQHGETKDGFIVCNEITSSAATIRVIYLQSDSHICFEFNNQSPCLHLFACTSNDFEIRITGGGELPVKKNEFIALSANRWLAEIRQRSNAMHTFIDIAWTRQISNLHEFPLPLHERIPAFIAEPYRPFCNNMKSIVHDLLHETLTGEQIRECVIQLFNLMCTAIDNENWPQDEMSAYDLSMIRKAQSLIGNNLETHFTIQDMARQLHINEQKYKQYFKRVTGRSPYDYRFYLLCHRAMKMLIETRMPAKSLYSQAGYASLSNFIAGFSKQLGLTPGEARKW